MRPLHASLACILFSSALCSAAAATSLAGGSSSSSSMWGVRGGSCLASIALPVPEVTSKPQLGSPQEASTTPTTGSGGGAFAELLAGSGRHQREDDIGRPRLISQGENDRLEYVSTCKLPTDKGHFLLHAYRYTKNGHQIEPVVISFGALSGKRGLLVRVHDQCLTSEVLGSRRCDCKDQLMMALKKIAHEGGAILYLPQEGRGIGLANKVAAYALQDLGYDTVDANLKLGFHDDERIYDYVPHILKDLGVQSIRLATNNPRKMKMLSELGVKIDETVRIEAPAHEDNLKYLITKTSRMAHRLELNGHDASDSEALPTAATSAHRSSDSSNSSPGGCACCGKKA